MANTILNLTTFLILLTLLALHNSNFVSSSDLIHDMMEEDEENEYYVLDAPFSRVGGSRSRFLASVIKKGTHCDRETNNVCNGVRANKGKDLLFCCKKHCRNVLSDKNNCNVCGHKCKQGQRCCNGVCTNVLSNVYHCGKCAKKCEAGDLCGNGICGYA